MGCPLKPRLPCPLLRLRLAEGELVPDGLEPRLTGGSRVSKHEGDGDAKSYLFTVRLVWLNYCGSALAFLSSRASASKFLMKLLILLLKGACSVPR